MKTCCPLVVVSSLSLPWNLLPISWHAVPILTDFLFYNRFEGEGDGQFWLAGQLVVSWWSVGAQRRLVRHVGPDPATSGCNTDTSRRLHLVTWLSGFYGPNSYLLIRMIYFYIVIQKISGFFRIFQDFSGFSGFFRRIIWESAGFSGMFRDSLAVHGIFQDSQRFLGIFWDFLGILGGFRGSLKTKTDFSVWKYEIFEILWDLLRDFQHFLGFLGIFWDSRGSWAQSLVIDQS